MEFTGWRWSLGISSLLSEKGGLNEIVKIYFIIGMFLINAKPIFCSEKVFLVSTNKFSYLLICNPLCLNVVLDFLLSLKALKGSNSLLGTSSNERSCLHPEERAMESFKVCAFAIVRVRVSVRITRERHV